MSRVTCEQAVRLLMDFLKRELPAETTEEIQRHLDACKPCERHARFESRFVVLLEQRLRGEVCPDRLKQKILDSLAKEQGD